MGAKKRAMMIGLDAADPKVIERLVGEGRLPNLKRAIEQGVSREDHAMIGVFPSVTPPNWCSIATGSYPRSHGVTCYFNHTLGRDLQKLESNWDSRRSENEFIWESFSRAGKKSVMLNYCEAWPPRFADENSIYVDGSGVIPFMRCNIDYQKVVTLKEGDFETIDKPHSIKQSTGDCVVEGDQYEKMLAGSEEEVEEDEFGANFDPMVDTDCIVTEKPFEAMAAAHVADKTTTAMAEPENWGFALPASAKVAHYNVNNGLARRYAVYSSSDGTTYDTLAIYAQRKVDEPLCVITGKTWAWPVFDTFVDGKTGEKVKVAYGVRPLAMAPDGSECEFLISHVINMDDTAMVYPESVGEALYKNVGPMLPFTKFGRHLEEYGAEPLLESLDMMHAWHENATKWLLTDACPDWDLFYIHLHSIDFIGHWYVQTSLPGSCENWKLSRDMIDAVYEINDRYVGMILDTFCNEDTSVFITSDHGIIPRSIGDENPGMGMLGGITTGVLEKLGYTVTKTNEDGSLGIDWTKTRAITQRSTYVYLNVKGRDPQGIVEPEDYKALVDEIIGALYSYRHPDTGKRVISFCMNREEMESVGMGGPHVGDILFELMPTYNKEHAFSPTTVTHEGCSLHNLCLMVGGGFKKGATINRTIRAVDIVPTICELTGGPVPRDVEGGVIWQALEGFDD